MRYIRHYNKAPKTIKWRYRDPTRRTPRSIVTVHLVLRRIQKIHTASKIYDTDVMACREWGHGSERVCGCRRGRPRTADGNRGGPQPVAQTRRAGAYRAGLGGSRVGAGGGAHPRGQPADGVAVATAL